MSTRLNPYLSFSRNAREAMEFYREVLGGDLEVNTFGEYGDKEAPEADLVMHSLLSTPSGFTLMAADTPPGMDFQVGTNITLSLSGDDAEELRGYWEALSADGTIGVPLEKQMWGDEFGMCVDKFGIGWLVNITGSEGQDS